MQNTTVTQKFFNVALAQKDDGVEHYAESVDFLGMFEAAHFDEELEAEGHWIGLIRDSGGMLQVVAEFVWEGEVTVGHDSGWAYYDDSGLI
jgi:hypothetical protein